MPDDTSHGTRVVPIQPQLEITACASFDEFYNHSRLHQFGGSSVCQLVSLMQACEGVLINQGGSGFP